MVQVDATLPGFRLLELGSLSGTVTTVMSPYALTSPPIAPNPHHPYSWGHASWGAFAGLGLGMDGLPATGDDELVTLTRNSISSTWDVSAYPLPAWVRAEGVAFNEAGTIAMWNSDANPAITITLISSHPSNPSSGLTTMIVPTSADGSGGPFGMRVFGDPGDTFRVAVEDGPAVDFCYRFIDNAGTAPSPGAEYCDDGQIYRSTLVADHSIARFNAYSWPLNQTNYTRFTPAGEMSFTTGMPDPVERFAEPHPGSLFVGLIQGDAVVISGLLGSNTMTTLPGSGSWYREPLKIGRGRVANFFATSGTYSDPPDTLVVIAAPGSPRIGTSDGFPFRFDVAPVVPHMGQPLRLQASALDPTYSGPATVFLAPNPGDPYALSGAPFAPGSVAHLDLGGPLLLLPITMTSGYGEVVIDTSGLPPQLSGLSTYAQAVFLDATIGTWFLSDARLIVI